MQQLQLYWPVSSVWADYLATPSSYLTHAIGDEVRCVSVRRRC